MDICPHCVVVLIMSGLAALPVIGHIFRRNYQRIKGAPHAITPAPVGVCGRGCNSHDRC